MEESEARQKICPHLKEHHQVNDGFYCYGSDCMMWEPEYERETLILRNELPPNDGSIWHNQGTVQNDEGRNATEWLVFKPTGSGDCGLKTKHLECNQ